MEELRKIVNENQTEFKFFLNFIFPHTMKWEGGGKLHNVPGDSGGYTIYGISWNNNKQHFKSFEEFKNISEGNAAMFAFVNYYLKLSPEFLKSNVKLVAFDTAFNIGVKPTIKFIQECAGVIADGIIGKNTKANMQRVEIDCLQNKRVNYYANLNKQVKYQKFYKGWMNRAEDIYKLSKLS